MHKFEQKEKNLNQCLEIFMSVIKDKQNNIYLNKYLNGNNSFDDLNNDLTLHK